MPGVRYGPDIADDAAKIMNRLVDLQDKVALKGKKLSKKDQAAFKKNADMAKKMFGLSASDIKKRKFGDMGLLAQYSTDGRILSGRKKINGKYSYKQAKRDKLAKNWKTGKTMKRRASDEHGARRTAPRVSEGGKDNRRTLISTSAVAEVGKSVTNAGGATYLARTAPKKYREARARSYDRMKAQKFTGNKFRGPIRDEADLDAVMTGRGSLGKQRPRLLSSRSGTFRKSGKPAKPTAAQTRRARQLSNTTGRAKKTAGGKGRVSRRPNVKVKKARKASSSARRRK